VDYDDQFKWLRHKLRLDAFSSLWALWGSIEFRVIPFADGVVGTEHQMIDDHDELRRRRLGHIDGLTGQTGINRLLQFSANVAELARHVVDVADVREDALELHLGDDHPALKADGLAVRHDGGGATLGGGAQACRDGTGGVRRAHGQRWVLASPLRDDLRIRVGG
jgi:hypothetical protein